MTLAAKIRFTVQVSAAHRGFIREVIAYYLESKPTPIAINWKTRKNNKRA